MVCVPKLTVHKLLFVYLSKIPFHSHCCSRGWTGLYSTAGKHRSPWAMTFKKCAGICLADRCQHRCNKYSTRCVLVAWGVSTRKVWQWFSLRGLAWQTPKKTSGRDNQSHKTLWSTFFVQLRLSALGSVHFSDRKKHVIWLFFCTKWNNHMLPAPVECGWLSWRGAMKNAPKVTLLPHVRKETVSAENGTIFWIHNVFTSPLHHSCACV